MPLRLYALWCAAWLVFSITEHQPRFVIAFFVIATIISATSLAARGAVRHQERQTLDRRHQLLAQRDAARAKRLAAELKRKEFTERARVDATIKPCTEGGPCRPGHRRVVRTAAGFRVATLCTRCRKQTYDQDYINHGILGK